MSTQFSRLSAAKKAQMKEVIEGWKRAGKSTGVLEEGLRMLSAANRHSAQEVCSLDIGQDVGFICTYGKGTRPKLALDKKDAKTLLDLVARIREIGCNEDENAYMVDVAMSAALNGEKPPFMLRGEAVEKFLKILSELDPMAIQSSLF